MPCVTVSSYTISSYSKKGGGSLCTTLLRHGTVRPNNVPDKGKGKGCTCSALAVVSCQRVKIDFEAGWLGHARALLAHVPPFG